MMRKKSKFQIYMACTALMSLVACGGGGGGDGGGFGGGFGGSGGGADGGTWVSNGQVVGEDGQGIPGVEVSVVLGGRAYGTVTGAGGLYQLQTPKNVDYPSYFAGIATRPDLVPQPVLFAYSGGQLSFNGNIATRPVTESDVIFPASAQVVHLGDSNYGGSVNSQFQYPNASGTVWLDKAALSQSQRAKYSKICISLVAKGIDKRAENVQSSVAISNNGQPGTYVVERLLPTDPSGAYSKLNNCFSLNGFNAGDFVQVQLNSYQEGSDYDDFEFIAVTGILE